MPETRGRNVAIDPTAQIDCANLSLGNGTIIGADVRISGQDVLIGRNVVISEGVAIGGFRHHNLARLVIGDDVYIGQRVQVALPSGVIGDYVKIHRSCSLYGQQKLVVGHNAWCGENSILNCSGGLYIGNNVGIATRNGIWTHIAHGEVLEGSTLRSFTPTVVWHNAWLLPDVTVSSGVEVAEYSVVFPNSVITKNTESFHLYAGTPATDITDKIRPYEPTSPGRRIQLMRGFIETFVEERQSSVKREDHKDLIVWSLDIGSSIALLLKPGQDPAELAPSLGHGMLIFGYGGRDAGAEWTYFDLKSKTYTKRYTEQERALISHLNSGLARFVPADNPVLEEQFLSECLAAIRGGQPN